LRQTCELSVEKGQIKDQNNHDAYHEQDFQETWLQLLKFNATLQLRKFSLKRSKIYLSACHQWFAHQVDETLKI
jgi:hypothetical protein